VARQRKSSKAVRGWHVVLTHQFCEAEAHKELTKQDYECAYPMMKLPTNSRGIQRVVPLFEGYVFVRESDRWWSIRGTRGVAHLLMGCERPAVLADDELQFFLSVCVDEFGYYTDPVVPVFRVGDEACPRFGSGGFDRQYGEITKLDRDGRCELLYRLLGRDVRVTVPVSALA
jgi:transcription antitermination factor NusG